MDKGKIQINNKADLKQNIKIRNLNKEENNPVNFQKYLTKGRIRIQRGIKTWRVPILMETGSEIDKLSNLSSSIS